MGSKSANPRPDALCGATTTGKATRNGEVIPKHPCQLKAGSGTDHLGYGRCKYHGGESETGKKAAAWEEAQAMRARFMVAPEPVSPEDALEEVLAATFALFRDLRRQIADAGSIDETPAKVWDLFAVESDRLERLARTTGGLKIDERRVQIAERQGQLMFEVMNRVFDDPVLGLLPEQRVLAPRVVRRHLLELTEGAPALPGGPQPDDSYEEAIVVRS